LIAPSVEPSKVPVCLAMSTEENFHTLVANVDYPMFIVTAVAHGTRAGCLVGFATQSSIDPPRLLVLLSKINRTYRLSQETDTLVVHFLHEGNHDLATLFGEETGDEVDKFAGCQWQEGPQHTPVLRGTRGWVAGSILGHLDAGDHVAHLLEVNTAMTDVPGRPLAFQTVRDMEPGHPA
jgi:flavin reductase (DIM6/NTAB) family NADH-FMN oxidoreductase RutF